MEFQVKIISNGLNIRSGPGTSYDIIGVIKDNGIYTIEETNDDETWGKIKGLINSWISISSTYVKRLEATTDDSGNIYDHGIFKRNNTNTGWVNYNDINEIYRRNDANTGWISGNQSENYATIYKRNKTNDAWIQIYPGGVVENSEDFVLEDSTKMANYRKNYGNWRKSYARQGWGIVSNANGPAGGIQFGLIGLKYSYVTGAGNVVDPGTPRFGGGTGGSGNYNATQLISFRGCKHSKWASGNPLGTHDSTGIFGYKWKSAGAYSTIPEGDLIMNSNNGRSTFLRWFNNTNGYGSWMCMYNGETNGTGSASSEYSANYLTIEKFNMQIRNYKYSAHRIHAIEYQNSKIMVAMSLSNTKTTDCYIDTVVPSNIATLSLNEIVTGIDNGTIDYVKPVDMMSYSDFDYKPCIMQQYGTTITTSPIFKDYELVQYEYNNEWYDAIILTPTTFNVLEDSTQARIINNLTGEIYFRMLLEWEK